MSIGTVQDIHSSVTRDPPLHRLRKVVRTESVPEGVAQRDVLSPKKREDTLTGEHDSIS